MLSVMLLFSCEREFDPDDYGLITDPRDGKVYNTVEIGGQTWLAENLKYLPVVNTPVLFSDTSRYFYVYDYYGTRVDRAEVTLDYITYGVLYNYSAALIACPEGWHLPDNDEWIELINIAGEENGRDLRSRLLWVSTDKGKNTTGFNALPAGCKEFGRFRELGSKAAFWSKEVSDDFQKKAYIWGFLTDLNRLESDTASLFNAYTVRCIEDRK